MALLVLRSIKRISHKLGLPSSFNAVSQGCKKIAVGNQSVLAPWKAHVRSLSCFSLKPKNELKFGGSLHLKGSLIERSLHATGANNSKTHRDQELVQFLIEEIATETKSQKIPVLPKVEGFSIETDGAEVTLTKKFQQENVVVKVNVNHTVDTEIPEGDLNPSQDKPELGEMKSKPNFTVEIEKAGNILSFSCSFIHDYTPEDAADPDAINDLFNINEVMFYRGELKDSIYSVSGETVDGYLYDLLMNLLEERGISSEFADQLSNYCTSYEHKMYINLLENIKAFVDGGK